MSKEIHCNNDYVCKEDIITLDEITDNTTCVALNNEVCSTCDTIRNVQHDNPQLFTNNPLRAIFAVDKSPDEIEQFWSLIKTKCDISKPESLKQSAPDFYVSEPDYDALLQDKNIILKRIREFVDSGYITDIAASNFVNIFYKIATLYHDTNPKNREQFSTDMYGILKYEECSSRMIHDPTSYPIQIQNMFYLFANTNDVKFKAITDLLNDKPTACLDGIIGPITNILNSQEYLNNGGKNITYKKRKFQKKKSSKRKKKSSKRKKKSLKRKK